MLVSKILIRENSRIELIMKYIRTIHYKQDLLTQKVFREHNLVILG